MKRNIFISILCLLTAMPLWAGPISKEVALNNAKAFIGGSHSGMKKVSGTNRQPMFQTVIETPNYYVFNIGQDEGFVIASGSDKTQAIFGYSDHGRIDPQHMPEPLKKWFSQLPLAVKYQELGLQQERRLAAPRKAPKVKTKNAVPVLVSSRWNQGDPYNQQTPSYINDKGGTEPHSATGCVATAMAQIMYFWKWPQEACKTIPSYSSNWNQQRTLPSLPPYVFEWDKMTDTYDSSSSQESKDAVSTLMKYVGYSIQMGYGPSSGAGTGMPPYALKSFYDYDQSLYHAIHDNYTFQEWEDLIYTELAAGRPVLISGDNSDLTGGHEWVCDGYDGNGLFHQNWGWGGMSDGYFVLTVMSPDNQGIGGSTSSDGYSMSHSIVVGLQPSYLAGGEDEDIRVTITSIKADRAQYSRTSTANEFNLRVTFNVCSTLKNQYTFETSFGIYDASGELVKETATQTMAIAAGAKLTQSKYARFAGLEDGRYTIKPRCRLAGTQEWYDMIDAEDNYLNAVISNEGTILTLESTNPPQGDYKLQFNDFELIGSSAVGSEQKVRVNITNIGTGEYYHNTFLIVDGQWVSGNCIAIPAGRTMDIYFKYKPEELGRHTFSVSTSKSANGRLFSKALVLEEAPKTTISIRVKLLNRYEGSTLYNNEMRLEVSVTNRGQADYNSWIKLSGWRWTTSGWGYGLSSKYFDVNVPVGKTIVFHHTMTDLEYTSHYGLDFEGNSGVLERPVKVNFDGPTITRGGITYWLNDGTKEGIAPQNGKLKVTADMAAISVPGVSSIPTISFDDEINPNVILYYEKDASIPSRLLNMIKGKVNNLVFGGEAENVVFSDNSPIYIPVAFNAAKVSYQRTAGEGWDTLVLPFSPQTVTADGQPADWFHSRKDADKQFVIKEYTALMGTRLYFNYIDTFTPNRPYLVSYKGEVGNSTYDIAGKEMVFSAENVELKPTEGLSTYANDYKFLGNYNAATTEKVYEVNAEGTIFYQQETLTGQPFRAYFVANNADAEAANALYVVGDNGLITGVNRPTADERRDGAIFNIAGQRVGAGYKGLVIRNGRVSKQ